MDRVKELEQKIGYVFKDKSLIERALMHKGRCKTPGKSRKCIRN